MPSPIVVSELTDKEILQMKYYAQYNHTTGELSKANVKCLNTNIDNIEISKEWFDSFEKCSYQDGQVVYNSDWIHIPTYEEVRQTRAKLYAQEVDPLMNEYTRKNTFNLFEGEEKTLLLSKIKTNVASIKQNNPYPDKGDNK